MHIVDWNQGTPVPAEELPPLITAWLAAHQARDTDAEFTSYAADAVVTDDGRTYRGRDEIRAWLDGAAGEYTYTATLLSAARIDDAHVELVQRLEGDFPGGVVDLRYRFTLAGASIKELVITV
jgi:ketosteroid isomerase-like protein